MAPPLLSLGRSTVYYLKGFNCFYRNLNPALATCICPGKYGKGLHLLSWAPAVNLVSPIRQLFGKMLGFNIILDSTSFSSIIPFNFSEKKLLLKTTTCKLQGLIWPSKKFWAYIVWASNSTSFSDSWNREGVDVLFPHCVTVPVICHIHTISCCCAARK